MGTTYPKVQGSSNTPQSMTVDLVSLQALFVNTSDDGQTILEIAEATGQPPGRIRKLIRRGVLDGVVAVGKRWVAPDWDGKNRTYTVYSMVDK